MYKIIKKITKEFLIKFFIKNIIIYFANIIERKYMYVIMKKNKFPNKYIEGEEKFKIKWRKLTKDVDVVYYRCFSKYLDEFPKFSENIISGNISVNYIEPILNPINYRKFYEDKNIYGKFYPKEWLPRTYLRKINGIYMDEDYEILKVGNNKEFYNILHNVEKFIIKPSVESNSGKGIEIYTKKNGNFVTQNNVELSLENIEKIYKNGFIMQEVVKQSQILSRFNQTSLNTMRLLVYRSVSDNKLYVTNALLKIGAKGSFLDNAHAGGVFIGINKLGVLNNFLSNSYGETINDFNGFDFKKPLFKIPNYENVIKFAKDVSREIPHHRLIALDIALDDNDNPILIEYNIEGFSYWYFQLVGQVTLNGFTDEIIDYCIAHKNDYPIRKIDIK